MGHLGAAEVALQGEQSAIGGADVGARQTSEQGMAVTAPQQSSELESARECVTTHLYTQQSLKMGGTAV